MDVWEVPHVRVVAVPLDEPLVAGEGRLEQIPSHRLEAGQG
jgi:hypothetical protein